MKPFSLLIITCLLSSVFPLLPKYDSKDTSDGYIIFDSSSFNEGEEMHFKIEALEYSYISIMDYVEYCYLNSENDDIDNIPSSYWYRANFKSTSYYSERFDNYARKHFTIKKQKSEFGTSTSGNYLFMKLPIQKDEWCKITNTEEDEGKLPTWAIIVIVVIVVIIIVVVIVCCIVRAKQRKQAIALSNAAAANYAAQQNMQAQAYQAQVNQAQIYQAQVNQAQAEAYQAQINQQAYQQIQNYQTPADYNNDVGYTSKAVV